MADQTDASDLSAEDSLALIEEQRGRVGRDLAPDPVLLFGTWGIAWVVGFLGSYAADRGWALSSLTAGLLFFALLVGGIVITAVHVARTSRGVRGVSSQLGAMYGWSWLLGFGCLFAISAGLARQDGGLTGDQWALFAPAGSLLIVGLMYLAGGLMWRDRVQYGLGVWILATDAASVFAGVPGNSLVLAIAGGGGFLAAAAWFAVQRRRGAAA